MDIKNMVTAITAIVVMIVLVVTVAVPVLSSLESTSESGENTWNGTTISLNSNSSNNLDVDDSGVLLNGERLTGLESMTPLIMANTFYVLYYNMTIQLVGVPENSQNVVGIVIKSGESLSMANGTATYTPSGDGAAITFQYSKLYCYDEDGEYALLLGSETFKASSSTTVTGWDFDPSFCFVNIEDGEITDYNAYTFGANGTPPTVETITGATTGYVKNDDGTVSYTAPFQIDYSGGSMTAFVIAPIHYGGSDQGEIGDIIAVIPVIMVVGVLIAAIGVFIPLRS